MLALDALKPLTEFYPAEIRAAFDEEWPRFRVLMARLALEVWSAEQDSVAYADAVQRAEFPLMSRVHYGLLDFLGETVPREFLETLDALFQAGRGGQFDGMGRAILAAASRPGADPESSLLRFLLYQLVRLRVWTFAWRYPELEATGLLRAMDQEAPARLFQLLAADADVDDVQPLNVLFAELVVRLRDCAKRRLDDLRGGAAETMDVFQRVVAAAAAARQLAPADAVIVRNAYAARVGEEELGSVQLMERHPGLFASPNALEQRRHRLVVAAEDGSLVRTPGTTRFIDVFASLEEKFG